MEDHIHIHGLEISVQIGLPDTSSDVVIPGGTTNNPTITTTTGSCKTLMINYDLGGRWIIDVAGSGRLTVAQ